LVTVRHIKSDLAARARKVINTSCAFFALASQGNDSSKKSPYLTPWCTGWCVEAFHSGECGKRRSAQLGEALALFSDM
jgi:hypothetical protein